MEFRLKKIIPSTHFLSTGISSFDPIFLIMNGETPEFITSSYLYDRALSGLRPTTMVSEAYKLVNFLEFCQLQSINYLNSQEAVEKYYEYLLGMVSSGELTATVAKQKLRVAISFYEWGVQDKNLGFCEFFIQKINFDIFVKVKRHIHKRINVSSNVWSRSLNELGREKNNLPASNNYLAKILEPQLIINFIAELSEKENSVIKLAFYLSFRFKISLDQVMKYNVSDLKRLCDIHGLRQLYNQYQKKIINDRVEIGGFNKYVFLNKIGRPFFIRSEDKNGVYANFQNGAAINDYLGKLKLRFNFTSSYIMPTLSSLFLAEKHRKIDTRNDAFDDADKNDDVDALIAKFGISFSKAEKLAEAFLQFYLTTTDLDQIDMALNKLLLVLEDDLDVKKLT